MAESGPSLGPAIHSVTCSTLRPGRTQAPSSSVPGVLPSVIGKHVGSYDDLHVGT